MHTETQNGGFSRNNIHILGDGDHTLVFAHGFGCDQHIWQAVVSQLLPHYRIVLFDYVGSGSANQQEFSAEKHSQIETYVDDLLNVLGAIDAHKVSYIGHSVSGAIGYLAAIAQPNAFAHIITIGPSPCYFNYPEEGYFGGFNVGDIHDLLHMMEHNFYEWAGYLAPQVTENPEQPEFAQQLARRFRANEPQMLQAFARATFMLDVRDKLAQVPVPVHILHSISDVVVPNDVISYQAQHIPRCSIEILPTHGHYPHITHPHEVVRAIQQQLERWG